MGKSPALPILLVLAGCSDRPPPAAFERAVASDPSVLETTLRAQTCAGAVLVTKDAACHTSTPGWTASRLFPPGEAPVARLLPFCVYEWSGEGPPVGRPFSREVDPSERDCLAVSGLATEAGIPAAD